MKRLQAAVRDRQARTWRERKLYYKVGGAFKGCRNCGTYEEEETDSGGVKLRYKSGFQVFRSYQPRYAGWTWKCFECAAKDLACWAPDLLGLVEDELGTEPILGNREVVRGRKYELRREAVKLSSVCDEHPARGGVREPSRDDRIRDLEDRAKKLMEMLKR